MNLAKFGGGKPLPEEVLFADIDEVTEGVHINGPQLRTKRVQVSFPRTSDDQWDQQNERNEAD